MADAARRAGERFDIRHAAHRIERLYRELAGRSDPAPATTP
jgi:hypothetical protein